MFRKIAILTALQWAMVLLGFFTLSIIMKKDGYPDGNYTLQWTWLALQLREHGIALLLVPSLWAVCTALAQYRFRLIHTFRSWLVLGLFLPFLLLALFLYASLHPFTRVLLMAH